MNHAATSPAFMTATSGNPATTESQTPSARRIHPPRRFLPAALTTYSMPSRQTGRNGTGFAGAFVIHAIAPFSPNAMPPAAAANGEQRSWRSSA